MGPHSPAHAAAYMSLQSRRDTYRTRSLPSGPFIKVSGRTYCNRTAFACPEEARWECFVSLPLIRLLTQNVYVRSRRRLARQPRQALDAWDRWSSHQEAQITATNKTLSYKCERIAATRDRAEQVRADDCS